MEGTQQPSPTLPRLVYTVEEATQITNLSRTTLWKAVKKGKLKKCNGFGRRVLFTRQALEEFVNQ